FTVFEAYPVQMCLFHQLMIIKRYLTKNPKLQPSKELKKVTKRLTTTTQTRFINKFQDWYVKHVDFINEKTINEETGKEEFTHRRLVRAFRSLNNNLPYLFTYKNHPELMIASTTNSLDGGVISNLKKLMSLHQGITKSLKTKLIDDYLINYNKRK
ncbi:MAG: transposase, partial [Thiovulaceae bacterium]|nr:transposase [Sulfurimonadaceae bacterium]